jgi:FkbM family methyltransferase
MGYTILPNWRLEHFPLASHLRRIFESFDIDCVLDVGANKGQYHDFLRDQVEYKGTIVSFEPIPDHVEILRRKAKIDHSWFIEDCALGSTRGQATFNIMESTQFSSFLEPDHSSTGTFEGRNEIAKKIPVDVKTIDELLPGLKDRLGFARPYLKLDTQGFDLEVIRGGHEQLKNILALQTEISVKAIYRNMPNYVQTIALMESVGFGISGIYPNNPDHFPEAFEFDCIMTNTTLTK